MALRYFRRNTLLLPLQEQYKPNRPSPIHRNVSSQTQMSTKGILENKGFHKSLRLQERRPSGNSFEQETRTSITRDLILNGITRIAPQDFTKLQRPRIHNLTQLELKESTQDPIPSELRPHDRLQFPSTQPVPHCAAQSHPKIATSQEA